MADVFISYKADVFISYSGESASALIPQIVSALEKCGISCWYDKRDMEPGDFAGAIARAIRDCKIFLLVLNRDSLQSAHVKSEITLAFRRIVNYEHITFLPFQVDRYNPKADSELSYYLGRFQIVDGCPPDMRRIQDLANRAARILRRQTSASVCRPAEQI